LRTLLWRVVTFVIANAGPIWKQHWTPFCAGYYAHIQKHLTLLLGLVGLLDFAR
jgi:hypothetical protein